MSSLSSVVDTSQLNDTCLTRVGKYRVNEHVGKTMAYLNRPGPLLVEYAILKSLEAMGYSLDPEKDNKSQYDPAKLVERLGRYGKPAVLVNANNEALQMAMDVTMRVFGGKGNLPVSQLNDDLRAVTHLDKSSGLPSLLTKSDAFDVDLARAARIAAGTRTPDPCLAFHRVQHGDDGPKTRLVWGYPQSVFLLEAMFAPTLIEHFLTNRTYPIAFGMYKSQVSARMQSIRNSGVRYSLDFSGFDSTIPAQLIDFAFTVLKSHFRPMSEVEERVWYLIIRYFIHTPIVMPDASIWRKHHGVPSGSYFTQMIDSIVNYLCVTYAFLRAGGQPIPDDKILVLGDDSLVGQSQLFDIDEIQSYLHEVGLTLNVDKTEVSFQGRNDPHFLGHVWRRGFPDRDESDVAKRMAFAEKLSGIRDGLTRRAVRVTSYVPDSVSAHRVAMAIAPVNSRNIVESYASFLRDTVPIGELSARDRPGWAAHMEEYGTMQSIGSESLAIRQPFVGLYF